MFVRYRLYGIFQLCLLTGLVFCTSCGAVPSAVLEPTSIVYASTSSAKRSPCDSLEDAADEREAYRNGGKVARLGSAASVKYDAAKNTITLLKGASLTLAALSQALDRPTALKELGSGQWLLAANLRIERGAALRIAAPEVRRLKLRSDTSSFVSIKALGGQLMFSGVCVTSWDGGDYDRSYADGRSFVLARDGAQMTIHNSELSYLGYDADESYGVAWRLAGTAGEIVDSHLAHNYYGLYAYRVAGLVIRGNEVHHSVRYGIDPHTRSKRLLIEDNRSHHNGKHGIILAEGCTNSVIRNNEVHHNAIHGIVLYQRSNDNLVEGNRSYANAGEGIDVNDSLGNTIKNNTVDDNAEAGIGVGQGAKENHVVGNHVRANRQDGIVLYSEATGNTLQANSVSNNARYGIYVKSEGNRIAAGNRVFGNAVGVFLNVDSPPELSLEDNRIYDNAKADVRTKDE